MFDKKMMKEMALKKLMEMLSGEESMEHEMMEDKEPMMKATIMADSEEGLLEGAKQLPKALSKAEEYMKGRMAEFEPKKKKK